jgi:hypothetical protein
MVQKHRISTNIGKDQVVKVELKQDFDLLEILSLKFTQKEVYTSLCADYGVVCGRISVNGGFGIPNAKVSIFVPLTLEDEQDQVISTLYPYKSTDTNDDNNYRYNLLPKRKQHSGHTPTGTFFDQQDILTREEYLEVYEKYYTYTVKTNDSGDFMIWGVPLGTQVVHVDLDLSDMGCQSLVPYDLMYEGISEEKFENKYTYMASDNLNALPQIISFDKTVDVYPFWGNEDLCEIGITRTDFDLGEKGVRLEPYAIMMGSTFSDAAEDSMGVRCNVDNQQGEKCKLTTKKGDIEAIRFTGEYEKDADGNPNMLRPILQKLQIDSTIGDDGIFFFRVPMNIGYITTNEFGDIVESRDKKIGIPTKGNYRFRITLNEDTGEENRNVAKMLIPNVREYHQGDVLYHGDYTTIDAKSYSFSTNIDDYPADALKEIAGLSTWAKANNRKGVPQDYFYQYRYGRVYSASQFINRYDKSSSWEKVFKFFVRDRNESFIGIKEIWPGEGDCSNTINYFPVNDAVRNHRFGFFITTIISFIEYIGLRISLFFKELVLAVFVGIAELLSSTGVSNKAAAKMFQRAKEYQFNNIMVLSLVTYPDCYDCSEDDTANKTTSSVPPVIIESVTGNTPTATNFYVEENYTVARAPGTCDKYTFANATSSDVTINYLDCDGDSRTVTILANSTSSVSAKPGQSQSGWAITPTIVVDGYAGANGFNSDDDLYFRPTGGGFAGFVPTPPAGQLTDDNAILRQTYVVELDVIGNGTLTYFTLGMGQQYQIVRDSSLGVWKIKGAYKVIIDAISTAFNSPLDTPVAGTSHANAGYVKITKLWVADDDITSSDTINVEQEEGCSKYDTIIEDELGRSGDMKLKGLIFPLTGQTTGGPVTVLNTYVDVKNYLNTRRPNGGNRFTITGRPYNQLDSNYNTRIIGANIEDCKERTPYNVGAVASTHAKWPMEERSDYYSIFGNNSYENQTVRCIYKGEYYGAVKKRGPYYVEEQLTLNGTVSGWSEFRDGVFRIIPCAGRTGELLNNYRRRKLFGKIMCGGVTSYTFSNSWLNGALYFFQFKKRGEDGFCHDCVYKKVETDGTVNYYYRSTPYNENYTHYESQGSSTVTPSDPNAIGYDGKSPNQRYLEKSTGFYGVRKSLSITLARVFSNATGQLVDGWTGWYRALGDGTDGNRVKREINFPTTVIDLGPRQTWIDEICVDPEMDVNCSITRSIGSTTYKGLDDLMEYVIQSKEIKEKGRLDIQDLFDKRGRGRIDGDIAQLLNFNTQVGIYPFEIELLNSPYTGYTGIFDGKGAVGVDLVFSEDDPNTPATVEVKGDLIRKCLNTKGRLGDKSQRVPYYMWDTYGHGFGEFEGADAGYSESQSFYTGKIYNQPIQEMRANLNEDPNGNTILTDNNYFDPYILPPIRDCIEVSGVKAKSNDNYKEYIVNGQARHLMEIGTPFHYQFGLKKGATAFDKFLENFGPK